MHVRRDEIALFSLISMRQSSFKLISLLLNTFEIFELLCQRRQNIPLVILPAGAFLKLPWPLDIQR